MGTNPNKRLYVSQWKVEDRNLIFSYYMRGGGNIVIDIPFDVFTIWLIQNDYYQIPYMKFSNGKLFLHLETCNTAFFIENYLNKEIIATYINEPHIYNPLKAHYIKQWTI